MKILNILLIATPLLWGYKTDQPEKQEKPLMVQVAMVTDTYFGKEVDDPY